MVLYNLALCHLQAQEYPLAIEAAKTCIDLILKREPPKTDPGAKTLQRNQSSSAAILPPHDTSKQEQGLNNSTIEMLADMHVLQGLSYLRSKNIKRAGRCFNEAKLYQVSRKTELQMLVESTSL